jgi:transposase-like protein
LPVLRDNSLEIVDLFLPIDLAKNSFQLHGVDEKGNRVLKKKLTRKQLVAFAFFKQAINNNGLPDKVVMDKSGANYAGLANINLLLILAGFG